MNPQPYTIDMEPQLKPGQGYVASYVVGRSDGSVIEWKMVPHRFSAYNEALADAYDAAQARVSALGTDVCHHNRGGNAFELFRFAVCTSAARTVQP